jgi:hypothetical protein
MGSTFHASWHNVADPGYLPLGRNEAEYVRADLVAAKDERIAELEAENAKLRRALDQAIEYGGHEVTELLKYKNDVKDHPDLAAYLREKETA